MKLTIFTFLSFLFIASIGFVSCKKKTGEVVSKVAMLTSSPWILDTAGVDLDGNGSIDMALSGTQVPPCVKDNFYTFNANGTGNADEGATKCNSTDPQTSSFNWSFNSNETEITFGGSVAGLTGSFRVLNLNNTQFKLAKDTALGGFPVSIILQLKH